MRIIAIISAAALTVAAGPALAQTAPEPPVAAGEATPGAARQDHLDLAGRYLELTQGGDLIKQMRGQIEDAYGQSGLSAEQNAWLVDSFTGMFTEVLETTIDELRDDVADSFTVQELETALAFYESPVGRSIIRKQVDMNAEMQQIMMPLLMPRLTALMEKFCVRFDCSAMGEAAAKHDR